MAYYAPIPYDPVYEAQRQAWEQSRATWDKNAPILQRNIWDYMTGAAGPEAGAQAAREILDVLRAASSSMPAESSINNLIRTLEPYAAADTAIEGGYRGFGIESESPSASWFTATPFSDALGVAHSDIIGPQRSVYSTDEIMAKYDELAKNNPRFRAMYTPADFAREAGYTQRSDGNWNAPPLGFQPAWQSGEYGSFGEALLDMAPYAGPFAGIGALAGGAAGAAGAAGAGEAAAGAAGAGTAGGAGAIDFASLVGIENPSTWGNLAELTSLGETAAAGTASAGALSDVAGATQASTGALPSTTPAYGTFDPFTTGVTNALPQTIGQSTIPGSTLGTFEPFVANLVPTGSAEALRALELFESGVGPAPQNIEPYSPGNDPGSDIITPESTTSQGPPPNPSTPSGPPVTDAADNVYNPADPTNPIPNTAPLGAQLRTLINGLGLPAGLTELLTNNLFSGSGDIDWNKLLAGGAGVAGSMYAADKYDKLARDAMDLMGGDALKSSRRNALSRYETNATSPSAFLADPWVQSALDHSTEARNRALSRTMPTAGNPAAETEIQKSAISSLFGNLMLPYRQQLANEAGVASGPAQAAQLATNIGAKGIDASMQGWNSAGYGLSGLGGGSGGSGNSMNILDLINGVNRLSTAFGT